MEPRGGRKGLGRLLGAAALAIGALGCRRNETAVPKDAEALTTRFVAGEKSAPGRRYHLPYRLFIPTGLPPGSRYPLIVHLHGWGVNGVDNVRQLTREAGHWVAPDVQSAHPAFVLVPQCPADDEWINRHTRPPYRNYRISEHPESDALTLVVELLQQLCREQPVDPERLYVTGYSMGGSGTWDLLARHPGLFAAGVPVTGVGDPSAAPALAQAAIWAFHGEQDEISPLTNSQETVEAVRRAGGFARLTSLPGVGHDSWTTAYGDRKLIEWLFAQRRRSARPTGSEAAP